MNSAKVNADNSLDNPSPSGSQPSTSGTTYDAPPVGVGRIPRRKFSRTFIVVVVTCLAFGILTYQTYFLRRRHLISDEPDHEIINWPIPSDLNTTRCIGWLNQRPTRPPRHPPTGIPTIRTWYNISVSAELVFLSRGFSTGLIQFVTSDEVGDEAKIDVNVTSYDRQDGRVCLINRDEGQIGVGIFTPDDINHSQNGLIQVNIVVRLPASSGKAPLFIKSLETDMPLFAHEIGDLRDVVDFHSVTLKTSNMPINIESLSAATASLTTSNSPIEGSFNTSSSLTLVTSNAPIKVDVGLANHGSSNLTGLLMVTSNAPLDASVSLLSESTGSRFRVIATTSLDSLNIDFPTSPADSVLTLHAHTSLFPATVSLDSAYEGTFSLRSSLVRPMVEYNEEVEDPTGNGRHRKVNIHSYHRDSVEGSVSWDSFEEVKSKGSVNVETSLSPIVLKF